MAVGDELEFNDVFLLERGAQKTGRLKLHKTGAVFRCTKTGKLTQVNSGDVQSCSWMKVARGYGFKVMLNAGPQFSFNGFKEADFGLLSDFLSKNFEISLNEVELSVKGWNWGTAKFQGSSLSFEVDEKPAFEIPLQDVSQAITGKHEVTLEFHQNDDADVSLMEMRFFVPTPVDSTDADPVKSFQEQVLSKADIIQATGDAIVTFQEVACLTPRGRYSMKVYPSFVQLHGKTYDYKIPYSTILRLFLLPHKDNRSMYFVVTMDPPIKQGQTRYPFLILQFLKDEDMDVHLNVTDEELQEKYDGKLTKEMSAPSFEIMSRVMKAVVGRKITVPGSFKSQQGFSCITCSYKASSGFLYPLERGFIFVHKPPVHVRFDEISSVNFARVAGGSGSSKYFDFEIETKGGTMYTFSSIAKEEYGKLFDFVAGKNLRIKNKGVKSQEQKRQEVWDSDEDEHDAYLEQIKAEAADSDSESDDESDDEEFKPASADEQDVREEYESNVSSTSESEGGEGEESDDQSKKKKKKKKVEKEKVEKKKKKSPVKANSPKRKAKAKSSEDQPRKKKAKKDPDAPKRALSAYMLWLNDTRQSIKDENPGISITELSKVAGQKWKALADKSQWEELAAEKKAEYQKEMAAYKSNQKPKPSTSPSPKKKGKTMKDFVKDQKSTTASPRKGEYKSAEFVDTDDSSDDDDEKPATSKAKSKPSKPKATPSKKKKKEKEASDSESEAPPPSSSEEEEAMSEGSESD